VPALTRRTRETGLAATTAPTVPLLRTRVRRRRAARPWRRGVAAVSAAAAIAAVVTGAALAVHPQPTAREAGGASMRTAVVSEPDAVVDPQSSTVDDRGAGAPVADLTTGPRANAGSGSNGAQPPHAHGPGGKGGEDAGGKGKADQDKGGNGQGEG
jgi:hypothetical protein